MSNSHTYTVSAMTCDHFERAVREGVCALAGVESVDVDLATGYLVVVGGIAAKDVAAAVREAGYEVTE